MANYDVQPRMEEITLFLPHRVADDVRLLASRYRTSFNGMLNIILAYYVGDGANHLSCEHCTLWRDYCVADLEPGTQTTVPLLDKGTVVVGLPVD